MDLIPSGIVKSFKLVQSANAYFPISVTVSGSSIDTSELHFLNMESSIAVGLPVIFAVLSDV